MTQAPRVANIFELHKQSSALEVESCVTPVLPIILLHFPMTHAFIVADLFQGCILLMPILEKGKVRFDIQNTQLLAAECSERGMVRNIESGIAIGHSFQEE